ncbi:MAG: hypothetical protein KAJ10_04625 [Thermodesulfovibrionia bacterium]|nr:hypothetical protein [Thermodesulfovibrionia bacterium]
MNYPENLNDLVLVGAHHIDTGYNEFTEWAELMIKQFGEEIKPHLEEIWLASKTFYDDELANKKLDINKTINSVNENNLIGTKKENIDTQKWKVSICRIINNSLLPNIILSLGAILIALRLFFPPRYCTVEGMRILYDRYIFQRLTENSYRDMCELMGLHNDFYTTLLQSLGIAVITGVIFYLLKGRKLK